MEKCCPGWACTPNCSLELLDNLQKRIYKTVGPSLVDCLEPLTHRRNVHSLIIFFRYYFGKCSTGSTGPVFLKEVF